MKLILMIVLFALFASCSSRPVLSEKAQEVQIVHSQRQIKGCTVAGKIVGEDAEGTEEVAHIDLRNNAIKNKADTVLIKETVQNGSEIRVIGIGYRCQSEE